jgi:hypothetical protein
MQRTNGFFDRDSKTISPNSPHSRTPKENREVYTHNQKQERVGECTFIIAHTSYNYNMSHMERLRMGIRALGTSPDLPSWQIHASHYYVCFCSLQHQNFSRLFNCRSGLVILSRIDR